MNRLVRPENVARAYRAAADEHNTPRAMAAYRVLSSYVTVSYQALLDEGWKFKPVFDESFLPCLRTCAVLKAVPVLDTCHEHPLFSDTVNYMARAVHDVRGHIAGGAYGYSFEDEYAAWETQDKHFERWASQHPAPDVTSDAASYLYTETVGQAAYFDTFGHFPNQKVSTL